MRGRRGESIARFPELACSAQRATFGYRCADEHALLHPMSLKPTAILFALCLGSVIASCIINPQPEPPGGDKSTPTGSCDGSSGRGSDEECDDDAPAGGCGGSDIDPGFGGNDQNSPDADAEVPDCPCDSCEADKADTDDDDAGGDADNDACDDADIDADDNSDADENPDSNADAETCDTHPDAC